MQDLRLHLDGILLDAMSLARQAGAVHMRYFRGNELDITAKLNDADIVTAADKAAERLIIDSIRRKYPDHSIPRRNRVRLCRPGIPAG